MVPESAEGIFRILEMVNEAHANLQFRPASSALLLYSLNVRRWCWPWLQVVNGAMPLAGRPRPWRTMVF